MGDLREKVATAIRNAVDPDGWSDALGWEDYLAEADAAIAAVPTGVKVKPLEWAPVLSMSDGYSGWDAESILGGYRIVVPPDGEAFLSGARAHRLKNSAAQTYNKQIVELKKFAQADYESRILSALQPAPMSVAEAARVLLEEHRRCSGIVMAERTPAENAAAQMGRRRLETIARALASPEGE